MKRTKTVSAERRAARIRVNRVATAHDLDYSEMAALLDMPTGTVYHWMVPQDHKNCAYPRISTLGPLNDALDELAGKRKAPIAPDPQLELPLEPPKATKPRPSMVDEAAILLEGYRAGLIKSSTQEHMYLLDHYRNLLTKGQ